MKKIFAYVFLSFLTGSVFAQFSINTAATNYSQDFNTLTSGTWTDNTLLTGWYARTDLTSPIASYGANTGSTTTGGLYAFGVAGTNPLTDRGLGYVSSNAFTGGSGTGKGYIGWRLLNNTGNPISAITVTWTGEQWRKENNAASHTLSLFYQTGATVTSLTGGTWTAAPSVFTSPIVGATAATVLDGNAPANRVANISVTITVTIPAGQEIMLRWEDLNDAGNDHFMAIDDITVNATAGGGGTPDIILSSPNPAVAAGNMQQGSTNNAIYRFDLAVTTADAVLNGVTINTAGTYAASDITNFKCWYSADNVFSPATDVLLSTKTLTLGAGTHIFPSFNNQTITNGSTGYIFISADITCAAIVSNNLSVNAITTADISFVSGNKSGSAFAGGLQTITAATPNNVTTPAASVANASSSLSWTNPAGCYDEVLIVASAVLPNTGTPTGDGTAYTPNTLYGAGTPLGIGFVVYKGSTSPQLITGLTNGVQYFYKFFTRFGTTWSSGIEVSATPALVTLPTDYFRSVASGSWASTATWESSSDSSSWIAATLAPGALAAHVVIRNSDSVYLAANTTTQNLTIQNSAIFNALTFTQTATVRFNLLNTATFYQGGTVTNVPGVEQVLAVTSTYRFNGTQTPASIALPEFGNLIWEPTPASAGTFQNLTATAPFNNGLVVRGNMTINIQGATPREIRFATGATVSRTHTIDGTLFITSSSSYVVVNNGNSPVVSTLNIGAGISLLAGVFQGLSTTGNTGDATVNMIGNISNAGGTFKGGVGTGAYNFNFTGVTSAAVALRSTDTFHHVSNVKPVSLTGVNNLVLASGKTLTIGGNIGLFNNSLITDGPIVGGNLAAHIVTNGNGYLVRKNIANATSSYFPIGATTTTFNPLTITNQDPATMDYSARVTNSINPPISVPLKAVNRTWTVMPSATPSSTDILFEYITGEGNASFNYASNLELGQYVPSNWNVIKTGIVPSGSYQANVTNITSLGSGTASPLVLGNFNSILAFNSVNVDYFTGIKLTNANKLNWKLTCNNTPRVTISLERSADSRSFVSLNTITADAARCAQPFDQTDAQPLPGMNYYRLKLTDADGKISYSNIIALLNATKGFDILNISPNPVTGSTMKLNVASATATRLEILIVDLAGRVMNRQSLKLVAGFNSFDINIANLSKGTYQVNGMSAEEKPAMVSFVKQ